MKMIRTVLANVLLVGLERKVAMPSESITFNSKNKNKIENTEKYKEKTNSIMRTKINKIQEKTKPYKDKDKYYEKNSKHRAENREAMRQTQREKYKKKQR